MGAESRPWLTLAEAQRKVRRSRATIYRWVQEGRVKTWRPLGRQMFNAADLEQAERDTRGQGMR